MRVLINALSATIGGGLTYARALIPLLRDRLSSLTVVCPDSLASGMPEGNGTIPVTASLVRGSRRFLWEKIHLEKLLRQREIHVLYTPYQVAVQPDNVKRVCAFRNMEPFFSSRYRYAAESAARNDLLRHLTARCFQQADRVIAVSDFAAEFAVGNLGLPKEKVRRVYHGRDETLLKADRAEDDAVRCQMGIGGPYVFTAGSLLPYRRTEDVIVAFEKSIAAADPLAVLVIAGSGTDRAYRRVLARAVNRSRCGSRIRMLGHVSREKMRALYKGCRMFVSASEVEACPNIGIEAMTAGCPVIAARSGPAEEIYERGALLYPPRDTVNLSELMMSLWSDDGLRREQGASATRRSEAFGWQACARETADVLESV